jgi:hypothetical protein
LSSADLADASLDANGTTEQLIEDMLQQTQGDHGELYLMLSDMLAAVPAELRMVLITATSSRAGEAQAYLAKHWLLDPSPEVRRAAAQGLGTALAHGRLDGGLAASLPALRNWLPADETRALVDALVKQAMRKQVAKGAPPSAWTVEGAQASLPDGAGAQTIAFPLKAGRKRAVAVVLLKHGEGVKDAYLLTGTAAECRQTLDIMQQGYGASPVPHSYVEQALSLALAEGLEHGRPPAPRLIEVAEACGFTSLQPAARTSEQILRDLDSDGRIAAARAPTRKKLLNASAAWEFTNPVVGSWFEDSDDSTGALDAATTNAERNAALWRFLDTRRVFWIDLVARAALLFDATQDFHRDSAICTGLAMVGGADLSKIRLLQTIHARTLARWEDDAGATIFDEDYDEDEDGDEDGDFEFVHDEPRPPPPPEQTGEFQALLNESPVTPAWVDGYLMAVYAAPNKVDPEGWLGGLLDLITPALTKEDFNRFLELLSLHANAANTAVGEDAAVLTAILRDFKGNAFPEWAAGFSQCQEAFVAAWPAKSLTKADRAMLRRIAEIANGRPVGRKDPAHVAEWLAGL